MLLAGDELGNSQGGNNNAYCQDNPTGWVDWSSERIMHHGMVPFVRRLIALRKAHPALRRQRFFSGKPAGNGLPDVLWVTPQGVAKSEEDWKFPDARCLAFFLNGSVPVTERAPEEIDRELPHLLLFLNGLHDVFPFIVPVDFDFRWRVLIDTAVELGHEPRGEFAKGDTYKAASRSLVMLRSVGARERGA